MNREELLQALGGHEWSDVEFKACRRGISEDAYRTVSAFANSAGGHLIFGITGNDGAYRVAGVDAFDSVQNDFLSALRGGKFNRRVRVNPLAVEIDGRTVLIFHIPEAPIHEKPVALGRDLHESYLRCGAGDEKVTENELRRLLTDAQGEQQDARVLDLDPTTCFDSDTLERYRAIILRRDPSENAAAQPIDWLQEVGLIIERHGVLRPTTASVLLFGTKRQVNGLLGRPIVDFQRLDRPFSEELPDGRWSDRLVCEQNLLLTWWALLDRFQKLIDEPFDLQPGTMERRDLPPDYLTFREATINLLVHQDFSDHQQWSYLHLWRNRWIFGNPGLPLPREEELYEPGPKPTRNPLLLAAFRRIGLSDQGGTGLRAINTSLRRLNYPLPIFTYDRSTLRFSLTIVREPLITEKQALFQAQLGVHLSDDEARLFAALSRNSRLRISEARALLGCTTAEARSLARKLATQGLVTTEGEGPTLVILADHLAERWAEASQPSLVQPATSVSDQADSGLTKPVTKPVTEPLTKLTGPQTILLRRCSTPQTREQLMAATGLKHRNYFMRKHLRPLIDRGLIEVVGDKKPTDPDLTYILTESGLRLAEVLPAAERE